MGKPQGTTPESSQLITMSRMIEGLENEIDKLHDGSKKLEAQLLETQHELALRMDILHEYPWCCRDAQCSRGWHHSPACKNWVLVF